MKFNLKIAENMQKPIHAKELAPLTGYATMTLYKYLTKWEKQNFLIKCDGWRYIVKKEVLIRLFEEEIESYLPSVNKYYQLQERLTKIRNE